MKVGNAMVLYKCGYQRQQEQEKGTSEVPNVAVAPRGRDSETTSKLHSSSGAAYAYWTDASLAKQCLLMLMEFHKLVFVEKIPPERFIKRS